MSVFTRFLSKPSRNPKIQSLLDHLAKAESAINSASVHLGDIYVGLDAELRGHPIDEFSLSSLSIQLTSSERFADNCTKADKYYREAVFHLQALRDEARDIPPADMLDRKRIRVRTRALVASLQYLLSSLKSTARLIDFNFRPDPDESSKLSAIWAFSSRLKSDISTALSAIAPHVPIDAALSSLAAIPDLGPNPF